MSATAFSQDLNSLNILVVDSLEDGLGEEQLLSGAPL